MGKYSRPEPAPTGAAVADRCRCFFAVTHNGSPRHQRESFAVADDIVNRSVPIVGSSMVFATMPWFSG